MNQMKKKEVNADTQINGQFERNAPNYEVMRSDLRQELDAIARDSIVSESLISLAEAYRNADNAEAGLAQLMAEIDKLVAMKVKAAKDAEILSLHRQLAAAKLDADNGWSRWSGSNRIVLRLQETLASRPLLDTTAVAWEVVRSADGVVVHATIERDKMNNDDLARLRKHYDVKEIKLIACPSL